MDIIAERCGFRKSLSAVPVYFCGVFLVFDRRGFKGGKGAAKLLRSKLIINLRAFEKSRGGVCGGSRPVKEKAEGVSRRLDCG